MTGALTQHLFIEYVESLLVDGFVSSSGPVSLSLSFARPDLRDKCHVVTWPSAVVRPSPSTASHILRSRVISLLTRTRTPRRVQTLPFPMEPRGNGNGFPRVVLVPGILAPGRAGCFQVFAPFFDRPFVPLGVCVEVCRGHRAEVQVCGPRTLRCDTNGVANVLDSWLGYADL